MCLIIINFVIKGINSSKLTHTTIIDWTKMEAALNDGSQYGASFSNYSDEEAFKKQLQLALEKEIELASGDSNEEFCDGGDYIKFKVMEFGVKILPTVIFFITGTYRYMKIRDIAQARVIFSKHFKAKFLISATMAVAYMLYAIVLWLIPPEMKHSGWVNRCHEDVYSIFYAL